MKHNELLAKHTIKNEISQLFPKYKNGNDIMNTKKVKPINHTNLLMSSSRFKMFK